MRPKPEVIDRYGDAAGAADAKWRNSAATVLDYMLSLEVAALFREQVPPDTPLYFEVSH